MRLRTYYTWVILLPLAIIAAVAAAGGDNGASTYRLGPGATVRWLYPRAPVRELVIYAVVASWLLWTLHRRSPAEFQRAVWRAPVFLAALHFLLPLVVVLVNGLVKRIAAEQGGRIVARVLVRLLMGFGYVGLIDWARRHLPVSEISEAGG
jgi:hypothetical protein